MSLYLSHSIPNSGLDLGLLAQPRHGCMRDPA